MVQRASSSSSVRFWVGSLGMAPPSSVARPVGRAVYALRVPCYAAKSGDASRLWREPGSGLTKVGTGAVGAPPEEDELVPHHRQAAREGGALEHRYRARALDLEDRLALDAAEVVVVSPAGRFVTGGVLGEVHGHDGAAGLEARQVPVDRRQPDGGVQRPRPLVHLLGGQRSLRFGEGPQDGLALVGSAAHGAMLPPLLRNENRSRGPGRADW